MAVDRQRVEEYSAELDAYLAGLRTDQAARALRAKLLDLLASGQIERTSLGELAREVGRALGPAMEGVVREVERLYDDLVALTNERYADLGLDLRRDATRIRALEATTRAEIGRYAEDTRREVARRVQRALAEGRTVAELERALRGITRKVDEHARVLAESQALRYARVLRYEKALQAEVTHFEYVGLVTSGTRPFCRAMAGVTAELATIGLLRNAVREPVVENCGGWRCKHLWEPDPFAERQTEGRFYTRKSGSRDLVVFTTPAGAARMDGAL